MGFHVRTHFSISHDDRENERITDPNSIYFYTDKIPKELHMRYAKGIIRIDIGGWEKRLNAFVCEETMVLHSANDTMKIEGTLMFIPTYKPKRILSIFDRAVDAVERLVLRRVRDR